MEKQLQRWHLCELTELFRTATEAYLVTCHTYTMESFWENTLKIMMRHRNDITIISRAFCVSNKTKKVKYSWDENRSSRVMSSGYLYCFLRGGSRTTAAAKMVLFVMIANGFKPLTIITKSPSWMLQLS